MTLAEIRAGVRRIHTLKKKTEKLTLDDLEARSGVDRAVIHRIESTNVKYRDYKPGMETIRAIVELGFQMNLADFFASLRRPEQDSDEHEMSGSATADLLYKEASPAAAATPTLVEASYGDPVLSLRVVAELRSFLFKISQLAIRTAEALAETARSHSGARAASSKKRRDPVQVDRRLPQRPRRVGGRKR